MRHLFFILSFLILFQHPAVALVNMKNASYSEKWVDIILPGKGPDFRVERFYNSRSLFIGIFGFGWCSDFETRLKTLTDGRIVLTECGGGLEVSYFPENFDQKSKTKTIDDIIKTHRKKNPTLTQQGIKKLRAKLLSDTKLRFNLSKKYGFINNSIIRSKKNNYISNNNTEVIKFTGKDYIRTLLDGSIQKFDLSGNLIQMADKTNKINLTYAGNRLSFIGDSTGRKIVFKYRPNGKLDRIHNGHGITAIYKFKGENLTKATTAWSKTYKYLYDQNHNLNKVTFPDGTDIAMTYEKRSDWIKSYKDRHGCSQIFNFVLSRDDPKNHYTSLVNKKCSGKVVESGKIEYWYKNFKKSKIKYLNRILSILSGVHKDSFYHPTFGRPISIARNDSTERYSYYRNGLTHIKEIKVYNRKRDLLSWVNNTYQYNSFKKVSDSNRVIFDKKGKRKKVIKTKFHYNSSGIFLSAKRPSTGEEIKVEYNPMGRISSLTNSKKIKFNLNYGTDHNKPEFIEQTNFGKVKIEYSASGEVTKVTSPKGRSIASSLIEKFLSFIDICGPAAEELII